MVSTNGGTHINMVVAAPKKFGYTEGQIRTVYDKYGEPLGTEGKAREEIIRSLIDKGWIRARRYPNNCWSLQVKKLTKKSKDYFYDFAHKIQKGVGGFKELDKYFPMKIGCESGIKNYEINKIGSGVLYSAQESGEVREKLTFVKDL